MAKVGVVAVPYIKVDHHYLIAYTTLDSLRKVERGPHTLDLIAVVNALVTTPEREALLRSFFNCWVENDQNILARAWNRGINLSFERGNDYSLVINLDLLFHPQYLIRLLAAVENLKDGLLWSGAAWANREDLATAPLSPGHDHGAAYAAFLISRELFKVVGEFDENFRPAYHEDSDMTQRIRLANRGVYTVKDALFFHFDRITLQGLTIENAETELLSTRKAMNESMDYYVRKWGGLPGNERFTVPFNGDQSRVS